MRSNASLNPLTIATLATNLAFSEKRILVATAAHANPKSLSERPIGRYMHA